MNCGCLWVCLLGGVGFASRLPLRARVPANPFFMSLLSLRVACLGCVASLALFLGGPLVRAADAPFELKEGDRVVFIGDRLIEAEQESGWIELMLTTRFPDRSVTFRNLGWNGDTPAGESRLGLALIQAGRETPDEGWRQLVRQIEEAKPTVVFLGYGMASSFAGTAGLPVFKEQMTRLLDTVERISPGARMVILSPIAHEALGGAWPDPRAHNEQLRAYSAALAQLAADRKARFVSLYTATEARVAAAAAQPALTFNGIHPTDNGFRVLAEIVERDLFDVERAGRWRATGVSMEPLRQAIVRKNEWFFHRSRPANMVYIFGFRKHEQGKNATEVFRFDQLIAAEERRIAQMRKPGAPAVPEIPRTAGQAGLPQKDQPYPEFKVDDALEVTLWAENPLLHKPVQMNFDARGRLWIASSELYPQIEPGQAANDKIVVLEDTTGAGRADKTTVFADGLVIPTGIEIGDGGAYVAQGTELLHFRDTDGDGRSDRRRTVLSGFGTEDTHHNLHTLRWGPDGRLYMNQSVYTRTDTETPTGVVRLKAGGMFRFDPRTHEMSIPYRGWINAWGHAFDDYGDSFVTDGAGSQGVTWAFPGATFRTLAPARRQAPSIGPGVYPKYCGIESLRSPLFPADWQGDLITADFRAHRIVRFKMSEDGAGFVTKEMPDLMRTTADSFRPIDLRLGPDGALYIADWSNPIIQHGEVDFRDPRRDKAHGRIWRVAPKGAKPLAKVDFETLSTPDLLKRLLPSNTYDQAKATHALVGRGAEKVVPELDRWMKTQMTERGKLHGLRLYQAFNRVPPGLLAELAAAKDSRVRGAAVRAVDGKNASGLEILEMRVNDEHPRVRLEAVLALGQVGSARAAELALSALDKPMDPFLDYAIWQAINDLAQPWLASVKSGAWRIAGREPQLEFALKAVEPAFASDVLGGLIAKGTVLLDGTGPWFELIAAAGGPAETQALYDRVLKGDLPEAASVRAVTALADAARLRAVTPATRRDDVATLLASGSQTRRIAAAQLSGAWKANAAVPRLRQMAGDAAAAPGVRSAAFAALRDIGGADVIAALKALSGAKTEASVRRDAAVTLAGLNFEAAAPDVLDVLKTTRDESQSQALWRALLSIKGVGTALADLPATAELPAEVARAGLRPAREGDRYQALAAVLAKSAGLTAASGPLTSAQFRTIAADALAKGDAMRGERLYRKAELACMACHAIGGAGGKIGPDLTSIGASAPADYLVESMLAPGAKIKEGYHSVQIVTLDGQEYSGMVARETGTEVTLRTAANQDISIPTKNISRRTNIGSLMPVGLIDTLLPEERLDLYQFLASLGKPGDYDAGKGGVARAWKLYLITAKNEQMGMERVASGDFSLTDWAPIVSLVNGTLPVAAIEAAFPTRTNSRGLFAGISFESTQGGKVDFALTGEAMGAWLNGKRVDPKSTFSVTARPGTNTLVIEIDPAHLPALRLSSNDVTFRMD